MIDHKYITGELLMLAFALGWWFAEFLRRHRR